MNTRELDGIRAAIDEAQAGLAKLADAVVDLQSLVGSKGCEGERDTPIAAAVAQLVGTYQHLGHAVHDTQRTLEQVWVDIPRKGKARNTHLRTVVGEAQSLANVTGRVAYVYGPGGVEARKEGRWIITTDPRVDSHILTRGYHWYTRELTCRPEAK